MKFSIIAITGLLTSASCALTDYAVHEKREFGNPKWVSSNVELDSRFVLPLSIGLTQQNLDKGHDFLMDVSDPKSPNYANHWNPEQIAEVFAPATETIEAVKEWLASHGISKDRLTFSKSSSWIRFNSTIGEAETLMQTKYKVFEHSDTKKTHIACDEYSVPVDIKTHIDFITPTIGFDAYLREPKRSRSLSKRDGAPQPVDGTPPVNDTVAGSVKPISGAIVGGPHPLINPAPDTSAGALSYCSSYITPACLRALYDFPVGTLDKSSFGIVEYAPNTYLQSDLNLFFADVATNVPVGYAPTMASIDGGVANFYYPNGQDESDLDLEYAIALVYPQKVTLYQAGDLVEGASFNNFLDAIDGSYCSYEGGDSPLDPVYPDPKAGGFKGPKNCGGFTPTSVISISYAAMEAALPAAYMDRQCNEYMKLGLQGVTIVISSGDNGVAGHGDVCCYYEGCYGGVLNAAGTGGAFNPTFPGTCPYITSVGATQIVPGASVTSAEEACETVIYSGGGFSNNFAIPSYQSSAVATYFKSHKPSYSALYYNNTGKSRAIPDISANGANYLVAIDGAGALIYGTSASAPTVGSIITLINNQRANAGKKPVGFINPVLYANPSALNDIKKGNNPGCLTNGFSAVSGWDPVTGLGTPNYTKLLKVFMALP